MKISIRTFAILIAYFGVLFSYFQNIQELGHTTFWWYSFLVILLLINWSLHADNDAEGAWKTAIIAIGFYAIVTMFFFLVSSWNH
ncbi:MAG: hypothetical protein AAGA30_18120 [Planctomycetota bacterium]